MSNILSPQLEILRLPLQKTLKGGVQVSNGGNLKVLDLPKLTTAYGQVYLRNSKLVNLNLPALTSIQGNIYITNNLKLEKVNLPKLKSMSGSNPSITLQNVKKLTEFVMPKNIDATVSVSLQNTGLKHFVYPKLNVRSLSMNQNYDLIDFVLPKWHGNRNSYYLRNNKVNGRFEIGIKSVVHGFGLYKNDIKNIRLPKLESVGHAFGVYNNKILEKLELPALKTVGHAFNAMNAPNLHTIDMPKMKKIEHSFYLNNNKKLRTINAPHLKVGHSVQYSGVPNGYSYQR
jgi:hypothetical protein